MADNTSQTGSDTIATDDVTTLNGGASSGVKVQRFKAGFGDDGTYRDASASFPFPVELHGNIEGFHPGAVPDTAQGGVGDVSIDPEGNTKIRGQVLTDEGSYRANFANTSLAVSIGSCTFTNGSAAVTGTGFLTADLQVGQYVKLDADAESAWAQVDYIASDTSLTLTANYSGTGGTSAASRAIVKPSTGSGGSIAVASGVLTMTSGTTNNARTEIRRTVDWSPVIKQCGVTVSQRIANQTIIIGLEHSSAATTRWFARFVLDGTTNTTVKCQSARNPTGAPSAAEIEETTITLPNGTSANSRRYRVEQMSDQARFYVDGVLVAQHVRAMPGTYDLLDSVVAIVNGTGAASSTTVTVDYDTTINHDKLMVGAFSDAEVLASSQAPGTTFSYSQAGIIAINTVLMQFDCVQFRQVMLQCTSMGTTGVVTPEFSNDGTTWVAPLCLNANTGATATTFNAALVLLIPVCGRFFRLRLSTATTGGTTTITALASHALTANFGLATQPVSGTISATQGAQGAGNTPWFVSQNDQQTADVASAAITTTTTTSAFSPSTNSGGQQVIIAVTVASGTSPTMDVAVEESDDGGTNWYPIHVFHRITATGIYRSGPLRTLGNRIRYVQNIGGTTPSFTRSITRSMFHQVGTSVVRQMVARASGSMYTIDVNTGTPSTTALVTAGLRNAQLVIDMGAITTTAPAIKLQGSDNHGGTWYDLPSGSLTAVANTCNQITVANIHAQMIRATVATTGSGATLNSLTVKAF